MKASLEKAKRSLESAQLLLRAGDFDGAVNRAYYACYDAARAVIEGVARIDPREVKTHSGLIRLFNLTIVKPGLMPFEMGRLLAREEQLRLFADYGDGIQDGREAELAVVQADQFVQACEALLTGPRNGEW